MTDEKHMLSTLQHRDSLVQRCANICNFAGRASVAVAALMDAWKVRRAAWGRTHHRQYAAVDSVR